MKIKLLEDKYKVLLIIFERSFIKDNMRVASISRKYIAYEINVGYGKMRNLEKNLIDEGLIEKVKEQAEKGYLITDKGMNIINEIQGDINESI
jgi:predicted transcriptional regulator